MSWGLHRLLLLVALVVEVRIAAHLDLLVLLDDGAAGAAEVDAQVAAGAAVDAVGLADFAALDATEADPGSVQRWVLN